MKRLFLFAVLIAWSGMAGAVVYKWTDAQGKTQYGDRPPDGVHAQVVELLGTHAANAQPARAQTASNAANSSAKPGADTAAPADDKVKNQVATDVAQTREKQCTDAQERYKHLIEGRRLYKDGANGEREYLTSQQIDTERVNTKREIDEVCSAAT
jgi:hypothetical protein